MINHIDTVSSHAPTDQTTAFTIEANESMFRMLTKDIYTNLILAVIREWSTNALDACISANLPQRFAAHLPTTEEPYFSVRDFGTGLSKSDLLGLYTTFGASTKRDDNTCNGTFGLGRMAGLAYSSSFTVESFIDGNSFLYLIAFVNGIPSATLLSEATTSESNGLRLTVPVEPTDIPEFRSNATDLYRYFDVKPELNLELDLLLPESDIAVDTWQFHDRASSILMSNVRYVIPSFSSLNTHGLSNILFTAPNGAVSINPGRESLSLDDRTKQWIQSAFDSAAAEYVAIANSHIASQSTVKDRITAYLKASDSAPYGLRNDISISFPEPTLSAYYDAKYHEFGNFPSCITLQHRYSGDIRSKNRYDINLRDLYNRTFIINDLKTNYSSAISAIQSEHGRCFIFSPYKTEYATFLATILPFIEALGITPIYTSAHQQARQSTTRTLSELQICASYSETTFGNSHAYDPAQQYFYVPLTGYVPTTFSDYKDLYALYHAVKSRIPHSLVGVQQKYLAAASSLPNFTPFSEARPLLVSAAKFYRAHGTRTYMYRLNELTSTPLLDTIRAEKARYDAFNKQCTAEDRILVPILSDTSDLDILEFTHTNHDSALSAAYPYLSDIHHRLGSDAANHYLKLEEFYATNSHKAD